MPFSMDFDENFPSQNPLCFNDNNYSSPSKNPTNNYLQDEYFNLNNAPSNSSSTIPIFSLHQPTCFEPFDSPTFGTNCIPNLDFFEYNNKPYIDHNHVGNYGALVPFMDNNHSYKSEEVGELGLGHHSHMVMATPLTMVSPSGVVAHPNPFNYREFGLSKPYKACDEGSCSSPKADLDMIRRSLSTPLVKRRGGRGHKRKVTLVKGQWTIEEDRRLVQLVERYGTRKWSQIAEMLTGRIGKQCRERWHNHLKPDIKKEIWSEEEDRILIKAHREIGNKWAEIAKNLPGRTENSIKNHWNATKRRQFSKRKCKSKFPNQSSLLQEYIKTLSPELINAGCRKKKITTRLTLQTNPDPDTSTDTNTITNSTNDGGLGDAYQMMAEHDQYDFSDVPDFDFDANLFEESSIESILDCVSTEDIDDDNNNATTAANNANAAAAPAACCEIMDDDAAMDLNAMLQSEEDQDQDQVDFGQMVDDQDHVRARF